MEDMTLQVVGAQHQIAQIVAVGRHVQPQGRLHRLAGGNRVADRTDAADALGDRRRVEGIAADQQRLESPKHLSLAPGLDDPALLHPRIDTQMPFDPGQRIDNNLAHERLPSPRKIQNSEASFKTRAKIRHE